MKKYSTLMGIIVVSVIGTLFHFVFEWTNNNTIVGIFTPINESIWEHLKLLFYPIFLYSIIEYMIKYDIRKYLLPARIVSVIIGMLFIVSSYYTIVGVFGTIPDWMNIAIYYLSVIIVFVLSNIMIKNKIHTTAKAAMVCISILLLIIILFTIWTFYPPVLNIFVDPVNSTRGIFKIV